MTQNTKGVQAFVRTIIFFIVMGGLSLITVPFILVIFGDELGLFFAIVMSGLNLWISGILAGMFYILPEWERLVLLRLGKYVGTKGPGFFVIPPFIYSAAAIVDTRIVTQQVEATATLTKDNVPTKITAAIEYEVENPQKAVVDVRDYLSSIVWLSTEALKNTTGSLDLKEILSNRDEIALDLKKQIDSDAAVYGINVRAVRITDIDTPTELIEELAVIARARRAAQAKTIQAEAEVQVAEKVAQASRILDETPGGFRLRELQNLSSMSKEESSMIIIYPQDSNMGENIAAASVATVNKQLRKQTAK